MKRLQFVLIIAIPLCWFFFKLLPVYTHPAACSTANFIYAENFEQFKIWFFQSHNQLIKAYDDSNNFLYVFSLWIFIHFLKYTTIQAALAISAISMFVSVYLLHRIVDTRFWSINLLLVGLLFMSTQIWTGALGDEILFQGMLWLLAIRSFWKHRYIWLMIWCTLNIVARPDNIFVMLPLIIISFTDIQEIKERDRRKFINRRIRRTITFLLLPLGVYYFYRFLYFGKILPYNWLHHHPLIESQQTLWIFSVDAFNYLKHYLRYFVAPLAIGVLFYFLKERMKMHLRYYAIAISMLIVPAIYMCTFPQTENIAFKNYYAIYLGLIILSLLFIRDFRSISQSITTAIFVFFFGFSNAFVMFEKTLQSYYNNMYYLSNDLASVKRATIATAEDNFLTWMGNWHTIFYNGKHEKNPKQLTANEIIDTNADLVIHDNKNFLGKEDDKFFVYGLPANTRQFEKQRKPDNSLDQFFYKYAFGVPVDKQKKVYFFVRKKSRNSKEIIEILNSHSGQKEENL